MFYPGSDLVGTKYHPIFESADPNRAPYGIVASSHVTPDSGTGLVHCAPAHGAEDYLVFTQLGLLDTQNPETLICHVDAEGKFSDKVGEVVGPVICNKLHGRDVLVNGTDAIIESLNEMGGVLIREERIKHKYPYDWKTNKPIIVTYEALTMRVCDITNCRITLSEPHLNGSRISDPLKTMHCLL